MQSVQFRLIDVFAHAPFTGNPAGVVLDADELTPAQMQAIAREVNASETAFLTRANDLHQPTRLRWFTPSREVDFCGHATLAAVHAIAEIGGLPADFASSDKRVTFETRAGVLRVQCESAPTGPGAPGVWWLHMPPAGLQPSGLNAKQIADGLGLQLPDLSPLTTPMRTRDDDVIVLVQERAKLFSMQPDFKKLGEWCQRNHIRGVCAATTDGLTETTHVHSRFFAPAAGVDEDPVTGSVHGPLATLLVVSELIPAASGRAVLNCSQGQPGGRGGEVRVLVQQSEGGYDVAISGRCYCVLDGVFRLGAS